jgi:hypothetical protein
MIVASVPFFNMLSVVILVCEGPQKGNEGVSKIKNSLINIGKNERMTKNVILSSSGENVTIGSNRVGGYPYPHTEWTAIYTILDIV